MKWPCPNLQYNVNGRIESLFQGVYLFKDNFSHIQTSTVKQVESVTCDSRYEIMLDAALTTVLLSLASSGPMFKHFSPGCQTPAKSDSSSTSLNFSFTQHTIFLDSYTIIYNAFAYSANLPLQKITCEISGYSAW